MAEKVRTIGVDSLMSNMTIHQTVRCAEWRSTCVRLKTVEQLSASAYLHHALKGVPPAKRPDRSIDCIEDTQV